MNTIKKILFRGLWEQIPPFRLVLGLCPSLAVTSTLFGGFGMGIATTFVLVCSNVIISLLRNVIHPKVRIAVFIVIIATFVVIVEMLVQAVAYPLYTLLGIFIPLIVVNCIILGRAESFASKNSVLHSLIDGFGTGIGFTLSLCVIGLIREIAGNGTVAGLQVFGSSFRPCALMAGAPGAFITIGSILAIMNAVDTAKKRGRL